MTKTINLLQARKQRDRATRRAQGDANAARFGEAKPVTELRRAETARQDRLHAAHRLDQDSGQGDD